MGLDSVEIVMRAEEVFGIAIKDSDAEKMITPRDMIEHIVSRVGYPGYTPCLKQRAFHRIRASLMRRFGLKREQIRLDTRLMEVVPRRERKNHVPEFFKELGIDQATGLVRPSWLTSSLTGAVLMLSLIAATYFMGLNLPAWLAGFAASVIIFGFLASVLTRGLRYEFEPAMATVEGLSHWVVVNSTNLIEMPPSQSSREQVAEKVRAIVIDVLGCEKEYREDAHFVKDLGVG